MQIIQDVQNWKDNRTIVAQAKFQNDQQKSGWMILNIETKESVDDDTQAYAAGLLEGYVTG